MKYGLMFIVSKDGEIEPIKWGMSSFIPDRSIILLEELTPAVWLWHGEKQSLIDRRIANRQAEALKGYGYKAADTVIGSKVRTIYEIDQRKVGKESETTLLNEEFQNIISMKTAPLNEHIVIFRYGEAKVSTIDKRRQEPLNIATVQKFEQIANEISEESQELEKDIMKTEKKLEVLEILDKPKFEFESYVKELPQTNLESTKEEVTLLLKAVESSPIIKNLLERVEQIEGKLDILINKIQDFKK